MLDAELRCFCELTAANEVEIALNDTAFVFKHGEELHRLFERMKPYISTHASKSAQSLFGG